MVAMWANIKSLYITKSLAHRLCLKQQLYFIMNVGEQIHIRSLNINSQDY